MSHAPSDDRQYPSRPVVGVGGVVLVEGRILLVRRRFEPLAGRWSLPGGVVELGETLETGLRREIAEETGLEVEVGPIVDAFDRITRDGEGRVRFHYVLVDFLCWPLGGSIAHASDVDAVELAAPAGLERFALTPKTLDVIARALVLARTSVPPRFADPPR
jgi:ADP-ribose pyrophosphatase YjhB (NUDIX family)